MARISPRFGFTVLTVAFWAFAVVVMISQWFHQRTESLDLVTSADVHQSTLVAARQVWVAFFLFCMGYVALCSAYVGIVWTMMRRRFPVSTQWKVVPASETAASLYSGG